jgi:hypothetical protein
MTNVDGKHCPASSDCCPASVGPLSGLHRTAVREHLYSILKGFVGNAAAEFDVDRVDEPVWNQKMTCI